MCRSTPLRITQTPGHSDQAWQELFDLVLAILRRFYTLTPEDLADLVQEVFVALLRRQKPAESPEYLRDLAVVVAHRTAMSWLRSRNRPATRRRVPWCDRFAETLIAPSMSEFEREIEEAKHRMPEDTRTVFHAVFIESRTQEEAAEHLGCSRATIRRLLAEARDLLRLWGIGEPENRWKSAPVDGPAREFSP